MDYNSAASKISRLIYLLILLISELLRNKSGAVLIIVELI